MKKKPKINPLTAEEAFFRLTANITPPRFRTYEDAMLFMECLRTKTRFPADKWVHPFEIRGNCSVQTQDYKNAPYELAYLVNKTT